MTPTELVRAIRKESSDERGELLLRLYLSGDLPSSVVQVGDHDAEYARVQDAVTNAMEE